MRFNYSIVKNFRNFSINKNPELKIKWDPGINLILGSNGSGKTNLLESLSILSGWGGFSRTSDLISWNSNENLRAFIGAEISGEENFNVTANISSKISLRLNEKMISFTDLRLILPSIIFLTGNSNLIDGSPSVRRLFIDRLCALFFPPYAKRLSDFKYITKTRTILLRQNRSPDRTTIPFCKLGGWIMDRRREVLEMLKSLMPEKKFMFEFHPSIKIPAEEFLLEQKRKNYNRELQLQRPLCGVNFDELSITLYENNKPASIALSRGQKRRLILYIIITAGKLIAMKLKREPILLLDDFTAELDSENRELTYKELVRTKWQIFLTAPEKPFATRKNFGGIKF